MSIAWPDERQCSRCKVTKAMDQFRIDRFPVICHDCREDGIKEEKAAKAIANRRAYLKRTYGITLEQWDAIFESQDKKCGNPLCPRTDPGDDHKWHLDHDHETDEIRGIICYWCNIGIGMFGDSVDRLQGAVDYLTNPPARNVLHQEA